MIELRIQAGRPAVPLVNLSAAIGRTEAARTVSHSIEAMMAFLDELDGDPDLEDGNDMEPDADREVSYSEWHTRGAKATSAGYEIGSTAQTSDDDEDADPAEDDGEDCCDAGDDRIAAGCAPAYRCSDRWQMVGNEDDGEEDGEASSTRVGRYSPRTPANDR